MENRPASFAADRRGSVTILTAFASTVLLGFSAISIDSAHLYFVKRRLQSATDMAAMAAVANPGAATAAAASAMAANGFPSATLQVALGTYTADPTLPAAARFSNASPGNAAEVIASTNESFILGSAFQVLVGSVHAGDAQASPAGFPVRTRAVARKQDLAAFTLGSGVAALNGGLLNSVLGSLLGTRFSLSLMDYQALASAKIDLFDFSDALAARGAITGPTYGSLTTSVVSQADMLNGLADSVRNNSQASAALRWLAIAVPPGTSQRLDKLIDLGSGGTVRLGSSHPYSAQVSALDMLAGVARLGGQGHIVTADLGASVPGLSSATLMLTIGEPAVGSSTFAAGPESTSLHTAQIRLLLNAQIAPDLLPFSLSVPVYLELAPATATVSGISCAAGASNASVALNVVSGLLDVWVGTVQQSDFGNWSAAPSVRPAVLANVAGSVRLDATSHVAPTSETGVLVTYSSADIKAARTQTVSSGLSSSAALSSLTTSTQISATALGWTAPALGLTRTASNALQASTPSIDAAISQTLSILGASIGNATTSVPGVRCGQSVLVN